MSGLFLLQIVSPSVSVCRLVEQRAMAGPELLLDSSIRMWVVLPIVFITFFVGIIRHYVTQLLHSDKKVDLEQVSDRWAECDIMCVCWASCLSAACVSVTMTLFLWYIDRNSEEKALSQIHVNFIYHVFLVRCRTFTVWVYGGADSLCTVAVKARFHMILHSRSKSLRAATLAS